MSRQSIQVAEQGTLEAVLSAVQSIQTQMSAGSSSEHLAWLTDYKLFGEESYVFNNKNKLHELYLDYDLVMNDNMINAEAFDWIVTAAESGQAHVGQALAAIHGMTETGTLAGLGTMGAVCNNETAMGAIIGNEAAINAVFASTAAMNVINSNNNALNVIGNDLTATIKYLSVINGFNSSNYNTVDSIVSDLDLMRVISKDEQSMHIVIANSSIMNGIVSDADALKIITDSTTAIDIITSNINATNILMSSESARNNLSNNYNSMSIVYGKEMSAIKYASGCAGLNVTNYNTATQLILDNGAFTSIVENIQSMVAISSSAHILYEITKSETARQTFNKSSVAKSPMTNRSKVYNAAYGALNNSSLFDRFTGTTNGSEHSRSTAYINKSNMNGVAVQLSPDDCIILGSTYRSVSLPIDYNEYSYISGTIYDLYGNIVSYTTEYSSSYTPYHVTFGGIKVVDADNSDVTIFVPKTV